MKTTNQIKRTVKDFIRAGDVHDIALLESTLHSDFQNIQNGFFDKPGIYVFSKDDYKTLVETKRFGGSPRTIEFLSIKDIGGIAHVDVFLESEFLKFNSHLVLVNEKDETWKVIHNIPTIEVK